MGIPGPKLMDLTTRGVNPGADILQENLLMMNKKRNIDRNILEKNAHVIAGAAVSINAFSAMMADYINMYYESQREAFKIYAHRQTAFYKWSVEKAKKGYEI